MLCLTACSNFLNLGNIFTSGDVQITVADAAGRSLTPANISVVSFRINGTGPGGAKVGPETNSTGSFSYTGIAGGLWTFTVEGLNASSEAVASGSAQLQVGTASSASIVLTPFAGTGTFTVELGWPGAQLADEVEATLESAGGNSIAVSFTMTADTAAYSTDLAAGSYSMSLSLKREGKRISRHLTEAVQIYKDKTTSWDYDFTDDDFKAIYTVTYDSNGAGSGTAPSDTELYFRGDTLTVQGDASTLALTNNTFTGWNTQDDGLGTGYNFGGTLTIGSESVTLYAVFLLNQCTGLTPADGSATNADWPVLSWDSLPGAASYEVQIVNDADGIEAFETAALTTASVNSLTTSSSNAPPAFGWYWRVRGVDAAGKKGLWSDTVHLTVGWYRHTIVLTGPDTDTTTTDTTPQLSWNAINGTTRYEMQMANTKETIATAAIQSMETATSWIPSDAFNNKADYFWRIRAVTTDIVTEDEIETDWSTFRNFRVQWGLEGPLDGICFPKELAQLASDNTLLGGTYIVNADLDLSGYANWTPIGTSTNKFTGTFDGNGHIISGLKTTGTTEYRGLFGYTGSGSHIRNVSLTGVSVAGGQYTGALIGYCEGNVSNCNASGTVTGTNGYIGGLIGYVQIPAVGSGIAIRDSWTNVTLSATSSVGGLIGQLKGLNFDNMVVVEDSYSVGSISGNSYVGGLIGQISDYADIRYCHAAGNVTGTSGWCGGLIGTVMSPSVSSSAALRVFVSNSHASGAVSGSSYCGGFIGVNGWYQQSSMTYNSGAHISSSYATGDVTGTGSTVGGFAGYNLRYSVIQDSYARGNVICTSGSSIGGFVGVNQSNASVIRSYSTGLITAGTSNVGGLIGNNSSATVTASYYDRTTSGRTDTGKGIPQYTAEMKTQSTFAGWDFTGDPAAGTDAVWAIDSYRIINNGYPYLKGNMPE